MLENPSFWQWLILAAVFLIIEIVAPMTFFLWLSLAAIASAVVAIMLPELGWQIQYGLFSVFCILSLIAWKKFTKGGSHDETDQPTLNQRNQKYLGRTLVLSQAIENGYGKVTVDDSQWKVIGEDASVGSKVKVVDVEGSILKVEPA